MGILGSTPHRFFLGPWSSSEQSSWEGSLYGDAQATIPIPSSYQDIGPTIMRERRLPNTAPSAPLCQGTSQSQYLAFYTFIGMGPACYIFSIWSPYSPPHLVWGKVSSPPRQHSYSFLQKLKSSFFSTSTSLCLWLLLPQLQSQPFNTL